jgi:hypothetical protein
VRRTLLLIVVLLVNGGLLWHFHDRYWYPTDDGLYSHIAERLLNGEVLNRDIQDIHPGYIHFVHAFAFRVFGTDLVSLRYPLILAGLAQAALAFAILRRRGYLVGVAGSIATTALGIIQFVDPTANWYCLSLSVFLAWWMVSLPLRHPARLLGAGILLGVLTLFRQLSGVWVAMGLLVVVLLELPGPARGRELVAGRALLATIAAGIGGYLVLNRSLEPGGLLLIAVWPIAILVWTFTTLRGRNEQVVSAVGQIGAGFAIAAAPLVLYHLYHHSFRIWIADTVLAASGETQMPFFSGGWYGALPIAALYQVISSHDAAKVVNGLYWAVLPVLSAVNGIVILRQLRKEVLPSELALPILAAFYAFVSLYLEGALYLYYSVGLTFLAVIWLSANGSWMRQSVWAAAAVAVSVVAIAFHAGQKWQRTPVQILEGQRVSAAWTGDGAGLARCSLRLEAADREIYGQFVSLIQSKSRRDESIFALPNDAELYFLADRRNPFRFYNSALGIRSKGDLRAVLHELVMHPPRIITFRPDDKYNNDMTRQIMDVVRSHYVRVDLIDGTEIYQYP